MVMWFPSSRYCTPDDPCKGVVDAKHSHGSDYETRELSIAPRVVRLIDLAFSESEES